jgi:NADH dehydrogenase (ubiquinone) Fe-S protein 6
MVRFINKEKQINPRFAIDLINEVAPAEEKTSIVSCDGGGGPTGHPKVYINLVCPLLTFDSK